MQNSEQTAQTTTESGNAAKLPVVRSLIHLPRYGGWVRVQCSRCKAKYNAGIPGNGAGWRWAKAEINEWWQRHVCDD